VKNLLKALRICFESFKPVFSILMDIISSLHHTLLILISEPISNICNNLLAAGTIRDI